MHLTRIFRHLLTPPWRVRRLFPPHVQREIESAIQQSERKHTGQIRFAVEGALHTLAVIRNQSARQRALEVFSQLRVWDTAQNNGVLIYLLMADRDVEIVADRGLHSRISRHEWDDICHVMETAFKQGEYARGVTDGIDAVGTHLASIYPAQDDNPNELPDSPVRL